MRRLNYLILFLVPLFVKAQVNKDSDLFRVMEIQDSIFFERGFNQCDLEYLDEHITDDLKFYHDQSGFQDKNAFFENTQKYICSDSEKKPIRKVDAISLEVYPLYNNGKLYGAIQKGVHHFYLREKDKDDVWTSTAKFTHVWIIENEIWKLSEVLSFDHRDPVIEKPKEDIERLLKDNNVPALGVGIIENGKLTKVEVYGTLDRQNTAPYNTIFKVASLTKPIVALTALKLIDKGLLELDASLYKYWIDPDIKNDKRYKELTPKIILTHQTGFPNWRYMTDSNKLTFQFDPGTKYQYSGEGFEYLRKAIENKLGKSIEELAKELLFTPLEMTDTRFWWDSGMDETRYAQNFNENGEKIEAVKYYEANAAANLLTTVEDYGKFLEYIINGQSQLRERNKIMKVNRDNFWEFDWLVRTSPSNLVLLMIFVPILFFIWLFKVGQLCERKLSVKPDYLFRSLLVIFFLGITLSFSTLVLGEFYDFDKYFNYIFWPVYLCFIYIDFYITKLTFKVENKKKYRSGFADKVGRFIVLSTLIPGAFLLQSTFNKLFVKD